MKIDIKLSLKKRKLIKWLILSFAAILGLVIICFGSYSAIYSKKIYARQYIGETSVGLKSKTAAAKILKDSTTNFLNQPIELTLTGSTKTYQIKLAEIGLTYDTDQSLDSAWNYGRDKKPTTAFWEQLKSIFVNNNIPAIFSYNQTALSDKISAIGKELDDPEKDYSFTYQNGQFVLASDRKSGKRIDQDLIKKEIIDQITNVSNAKITFSLNEYSPHVTDDNAKARLAEANKILSFGDLALKTDTQSFDLDKDTIGGLLGSTAVGDDLQITFNDDRLKVFVQSTAKAVDVLPVSSKLTVNNGVAAVFQPSQDGKTLDQDQTIENIKSVLLSRISGSGDSMKSITLNIATQKPDVSDNDVNNLGIKELVGTATTDFKNSPVNRVHNIQIGAAALNGVLLKPNEEFSTLAHLGTIDGTTGYLPELVIKNDQTVPDYGGGLCQVSSTLFRAALNAGMTITERQNHSYRVSYYEPPIGMDATIYDPAPDFKFLNTFSSDILIQSKIDGTKITFELYGTKDGRVINMTTPVGYDYVSPPAPVMTPTDTLPVGQTKLVSHSHQGASASFDYKVTSADGKVLQSKTFVSKYAALPEQWLVGTAAVAPPVSTCTDGAQNGDETGVDCGGSCPSACQ